MKIKTLLSTLFLLGAMASSYAQLNMELKSTVQYNTSLNDIWGWHNPADGIEYAIVGKNDGVSFVSLEDPDNAVEVASIPGQSSTWRDIKTWDHYAYVTTDQGGTTEGLTVINMEFLPDSVQYYHWTPTIPGLGTLNTIHNLYIDESGYCYLAGANINNGGLLYIDVFTDPWNPQYVDKGVAVYSHDVYVRDNKTYSSEINEGELSIYDVTDKNNTVLLGKTTTPFEFTHNSWLNDAGTVAFTTDELANAPIGSYDVSDPEDIKYLDEYAPLETLGDGVIPHNVHVWQDWIIVSYYSDGGIIIDAQYPDNLIEVGNFDTFFGGGQGFNGTWGAYPFLPSGLVLLTSIDEGLFVLEADYKRACYIEGTVTNSVTGDPLQSVEIEIMSGQLNAQSTDLSGEYKGGQEMAGTFDVMFSKPGFFPQTIPATLENGEITIIDVQLVPKATLELSVVTDVDGNPVPGAKVILDGTSDFSITTDNDGTFVLSGFEPGSYTVYAGQWGYYHSSENLNISGSEAVELTLTPGYQDDFFADFGWVESGDAETGAFELGVPEGSTFGQNGLGSPDGDVLTDLGTMAYVTGNGGGNGGANDVDNGTTRITSPNMDWSAWIAPVISFDAWVFNDGGGQGSGEPNDTLMVFLDNGIEEVLVTKVAQTNQSYVSSGDISLIGLMDFTENMTLSFEISDFNGTGHLVEAVVDKFYSYNDSTIDTKEIIQGGVSMTAYPNPFEGALTLSYELDEAYNTAELVIYNMLGQAIERAPLANQKGIVQIGNQLTQGAYFVKIQNGSAILGVEKIVKTK